MTRAVVCRELGPPDRLTIGELPDPIPGPGQVVIDVHTAAFNFPDLLIIQGLYQFRAAPPFAPGAEAAGVVSAVGTGVDHVVVGDRVAAFGSHGAFADRWAVDAATVVRLPPGVDDATAAASTMSFGTSYHALVDRAGLSSGDTMLVLGAAGGVGSAAVELGAVMGATVIAAASTEEKLAFCREVGADLTINYADEDLRTRVRELTDGRGVDVVYDPVGGAFSEAAFRSIAVGGRHLVVGFTAGDIPSIPLNLPLLKAASIVGVFWGAFATRDPVAYRSHARTIHAMLEDGSVSPRITERVPFEEFRRGFDLIASRAAMGKVLLDVTR